MNLPTSETDPALIENPETPKTRGQRIATRIGWIFFTVFCLVFFTLAKLPDDRIKGYIDGNISAALGPKGITFTSEDSHLSFLFGPSYTMKDVKLFLPPPAPPIHVDLIEISPSLIPMILGSLGGNFSIKNGDGSLSGSFSMKKSDVSFSFKSKKLDLGRLGVLPIATGIQGSGTLDGTGSLSGDMDVPSSLDGNIDLRLSKIVLDPQTIQGFSVPRLSISEGTINLVFDKSKATIKTFHIGKKETSDDIQATVAGDVSLGKQWDSSQLNVKAHFSLSQNILKSFSLLDMILGIGKLADDSYAFNLTGPISSPIPTPVKE